MQTVNMHEAKTHLSRLVEKASKGEPFIIARAGKPLVKVVGLDVLQTKPKSRFGFLKGMIKVPETRDDFKAIGAEEIEEMFYGDHE